MDIFKKKRNSLTVKFEGDNCCLKVRETRIEKLEISKFNHVR